jgi:YVTN family beta-propeller protein
MFLPIVPGILHETAGDPTKGKEASVRLRRPIALGLADGGKTLLVANRDSGTVARVDTAKGRVTAEIRVGRKLSDMAMAPAGDLLLVTDEEAGEVVWVAHRQGSLREVRRLAVGMSPVSVRITAGGTLASVACLWPRRLVTVDARASLKSAGERTVIDLPFAPRRQFPVPGTSKLIVADAFGGKPAVVDSRHAKIDAVRDLAVHNIRSLAPDRGSKNLWLSHQVLHAQGHTTQSDIRTGNLVTNNVRRLSLAALLDPLADVLGNDQVYSLGDVERGAGDPAEAAETPDGNLLVALSGVNEVAIGRPEQGIWTRLKVGARPTAVAVNPAARRAYVANTFSDSVSVIDLQRLQVLAEIRLGTVPKLEAHERGEMVFFDARLSFEAWFSCHTCHTDGHTSGRLNDNFTDGSFGTPKRVLSLLGVKDTGPWAWNGKMQNLETQVRTSLGSTMQGPTPPADQVRDLTAYLRTLTPPPSLLQARGALDPKAFQRGRKVFTRQKCAACHTPPTYCRFQLTTFAL